MCIHVCTPRTLSAVLSLGDGFSEIRSALFKEQSTDMDLTLSTSCGQVNRLKCWRFSLESDYIHFLMLFPPPQMSFPHALVCLKPTQCFKIQLWDHLLHKAIYNSSVRITSLFSEFTMPLFLWIHPAYIMFWFARWFSSCLITNTGLLILWEQNLCLLQLCISEWQGKLLGNAISRNIYWIRTYNNILICVFFFLG